MLTPRTKDITIEHMNKAYQYIDEVIKERGYAPSVMDITKVSWICFQIFNTSDFKNDGR